MTHSTRDRCECEECLQLYACGTDIEAIESLLASTFLRDQMQIVVEKMLGEDTPEMSRDMFRGLAQSICAKNANAMH